MRVSPGLRGDGETNGGVQACARVEEGPKGPVRGFQGKSKNAWDPGGGQKIQGVSPPAQRSRGEAVPQEREGKCRGEVPHRLSKKTRPVTVAYRSCEAGHPAMRRNRESGTASLPETRMGAKSSRVKEPGQASRKRFGERNRHHTDVRGVSP